MNQTWREAFLENDSFNFCLNEMDADGGPGIARATTKSAT